MEIEYTDFGLNIPGIFSLTWDRLTELPHPIVYSIDVGSGDESQEVTIKILTRSDRFVFLETLRTSGPSYKYETTYKVGDYINRVWI